MTREELLEKYADAYRTFSNANLYGVDLSGIILEGAELFGAHMDGVNLTGADLTDADLRNTAFGDDNEREG